MGLSIFVKCAKYPVGLNNTGYRWEKILWKQKKRWRNHFFYIVFNIREDLQRQSCSILLNYTRNKQFTKSTRACIEGRNSFTVPIRFDQIFLLYTKQLSYWYSVSAKFLLTRHFFQLGSNKSRIVCRGSPSMPTELVNPKYRETSIWRRMERVQEREGEGNVGFVQWKGDVCEWWRTRSKHDGRADWMLNIGVAGQNSMTSLHGSTSRRLSMRTV